MSRQVVLLRGVNVGRHNRLSSAAFRAALEAVGARDAEIYLQSGNAVVEWSGPPGHLAVQVAASLRESAGVEVPVTTRTAAELAATVADNPYDMSGREPKLFHVGFLLGPVPQQQWSAVDHERLLPSSCALGDGVVYLDYVGSVHRNPLDRLRLGVELTARNWRTVLALHALAG